MSQPPKILCVSANPAVDRKIIFPTFRVGEVNRASGAHPAVGGKAAHVALAARTLGAKVTWIAFLGGPEGDLCCRELTEHDVTPIGIPVQGHTRTNLELYESESGRITEVLEPGPTISPAEAESFLVTYRAHLEDRPAVVISGSLPGGLTPDFYVQLIRIAKDKGCQVLLDTSGHALSQSLAALPDVIKPNRQEASALLGRELCTLENAIEAARQLRQLGVAAAIVSLGDQGAVVATDNAVLFGLPPQVKAKSTVGSGDCFLAGWAVTQAQGKDARDCLRTAIASGTANCLADIPAHIHLSAVNEFYSAVRIEEH